MTAGREVSVDDKEILEVFEESPDPFLFTGEVADGIDFSTRGTLNRLHELAEKGLIDTKRSGKVPGWWLTDRGRAYLAGDLDAADLEDE